MGFQKKKKEEVVAKSVVEVPIGNKEKMERLQTISKQLDKQHATTNTLMRLGSRVGIAIPSISLELPTLDYEVLGCGGIPRGRIIEIYGPESSGKTTLCLEIAAAEQSLGGIVAYVDAEHALDATYASELGVDVDNLLISQPDYGEQALNTVETLVDSGCVSLIIVDSAAALVPKAELEGEMGDAAIGLQARLMSQAMRKLIGKTAKANVVVIFINQIRDKIGVMYGSPETTPGGRALKFYASVRLDVRRKDAIKIQPGERLVGHQLKIKAVKNKVGTPLHETVIDLYYPGNEFEAGFDKVSNLIEYASMRGLFEIAGCWYSIDLEKKDEKGKPIGPERLSQGLDNLKIALRDRPEIVAFLRKKITTLIKEENAAAKKGL
jgi:recombination protein RecA